jgi:hypothetical protein
VAQSSLEFFMPYGSATSQQLDDLTEREWHELQALRRAISDGPASVHPTKMERFSELFARSLAGKGDRMVYDDSEVFSSPRTSNGNQC